MDELTLVKELSVMRKDIGTALKGCLDNLYAKYNPPVDVVHSNSDTEQHYHMHMSMVDYKVFTELASTYKKAADMAKKHLDSNANDMVLDITTQPNETNTIYEGEFVFSKRQNKDSTSVAVKDVVTELAKAGVDSAQVNKAVLAATKPKKGAVYYEVELNDG